MSIQKSLIKLTISLLFFLILNNCGGTKASPGTPTNALERARKNVEEGRGVSLKNVFKRGSTNYEFSTSNSLWRASLETMDFMPFATVDYSGGIIITDWYNDSKNSLESIKITLRFLDNEIRSDSVKIIVHRKTCNKDIVCSINEIDSRIKEELLREIIKKASLIEKEKKEEK